MNNIIPQMVVVYTQPEEVMADLVDMSYVIDEAGNGNLTLTYSADLKNVLQADLESIIRIATQKIADYAGTHEGLAMTRSASVNLQEHIEYPDDMGDFDFYDDGDLQF